MKKNDILVFDGRTKIKCWRVPKGFHRAVFKNIEVDSANRYVLRFLITSLKDDIEEYWVRHAYRREDMSLLWKTLSIMLGKEEFRKFAMLGGGSLEKYYGREFDLEVDLLVKENENEPLRIIKSVHPAGACVHLPTNERDLVGEYEI